MRAIGVDFGSKRIGIALSDSSGRVATPLQTVQRTGDRARDHRALQSLVDEWEAEVVVVGMPYRLDGAVGPAAEAMAAEVEQLRATIDVPVEIYDERLTTVTAQRAIIDMNLNPDARRKVVDQIAASVMLQSWLDTRRNSGPECGDDT